MENIYPKAYKEVIEILNFVPEESINKIPKSVLDTFKTKMDINYNFTIDLNKKIDELELLDETKAILANIFLDYWATPSQKEKINNINNYARKELNEYKESKYSKEDIFKNDKIKNVEKHIDLPIENEKEKFYTRILKLIKKFLHKIDRGSK